MKFDPLASGECVVGMIMVTSYDDHKSSISEGKKKRIKG